jgi:nucleotide-binding universal stress UspA family protein
MTKTSDKAAREAATADGLLGDEVLALPVKRWPGWARSATPATPRAAARPRSPSR